MAKIDATMILNIIKAVGGAGNINNATNCMTRLRITVNNSASVDETSLKKIPGVMGVVEADGQLQIIVGPGKAQTASNLMNELLSSDQVDTTTDSNPSQSLEEIAAKQKANLKSKQTNPIQVFLAKFARIFTPLIPGFIGAGLLAGLASVLAQIYKTPDPNIVHLIAFMTSFSKLLFLLLPMLVGYNTQKEFGGSGVNGAIIGAFFIVILSGSGEPVNGLESFFGMAINQNGGVVGALMGGILGAYVERGIRKIMPDNLDMVLTSFFTLFITGVITFLAIMPIAHQLFEGMAFLFDKLNNHPLGAAVLAGLFLISVVFGVHQGFVPVYDSLFKSLSRNTLFPILAVAGGAQVGASLALYLKAPKESVLRKQIKGAIIPGILGVGEPLIYGVTLPRVRPFITSCIGAAFGGFFIGLMAYLGYSVGLNSIFGPAGVMALPLMTSNKGIYPGMLIYFTGLMISYVAGFIITLLFGTKNVDLS